MASACASIDVTHHRAASTGQDNGPDLLFSNESIGRSLSFERDELSEDINEFNGSLTVALDTWHLGGHSGAIRYRGFDSGEDFPNLARPRYASGLPRDFETPWLARMTSAEGSNVHRVEFANGSSEIVFRGPRGANEAESNRFSTLIPIPNSSHFELVTSTGARYRFDVGNCLSYEFDPYEYPDVGGGQLPSLVDSGGHCEASEVTDLDGHGLRVEYYGVSDDIQDQGEPRNDTFIPRLIESFERRGGQRIATGRAYFYLRDQLGQGQPTAPPPQRYDLSFPSCPTVLVDVAQGPAFEDPVWVRQCDREWQGSRELNDYLIGAIVYPGANSDPLQIDGTWLTTRFSWNLSNLDVGSEASITTPSGTYRYVFGTHQVQLTQDGNSEDGNDGPTVRSHRLLQQLTTPMGSVHRFEWSPVNIAPTHELIDVGSNGDAAEYLLSNGASIRYRWFGDHTVARFQRLMVSGRTETVVGDGHGSEALLSWQIRRVELPDLSGERYLGAFTSYPNGLHTLSLFFRPLPWGEIATHLESHAPRAAKVGYLAHRYSFAGPIWDSENNRPRAPLEVLIPEAVQHQALGYASMRFRDQGCDDSDGASYPCNFEVLPSFEVTQNFTGPATGLNICQSVVYEVEQGEVLDTVSVLCAAPQPGACLTGDDVIDWGDRCDRVCYRVTVGDRVVRCETDGLVPLTCPGGAATISASACQVGEQPAISRVVQRRENRPNAFALSSFAENGRGDFDMFGRSAFERTQAAGMVRVVRSQGSCGLAGAAPCQQDYVVPYEVDASEGAETRIEYAVETLSSPNEYREVIAQGRVSQPSVTRRCAVSSTCTGTSLLEQTNFYHGDAGPAYPAASGGPTGSAAPHRLRAVEQVNLDNPSNSPTLYRAYYGDGDLAPNGALAEEAATHELGRLIRSRVVYSGANQELRHVHQLNNDGSRSQLLEAREVNHLGEPVWQEDQHGNRVHYCYDGRGRLSAAYQPLDTFVGCGAANSSANSPSMGFAYLDQSGTQAVDSIIRYSREGQTYLDHRLSYFDSLGREFLRQSERQTATGPLSQSVSTRYHSDTDRPEYRSHPYVEAGSVTAQNGAHPNYEGTGQVFAYDVFGRVVMAGSRASDGSTSSETRVLRGDLDETLAPLEHQIFRAGETTESSIFDRLGRVVETRLADGASIRRAYDRLGRLTQVTHPDGLQSVTTYDGLGRIVSQTSPESGISRLTYNLAGQVVRSVNANNQTTYFVYDDLARLSQRRSGGQAGPVEVELTYDAYPSTSQTTNQSFAMGRITRARTPSSVVDYGYDRAGNVIEQVTGQSGLGLKRLRQSFDAQGTVIAQMYQSAGDPDFATFEYRMQGPHYEPTETRFNGLAYETLSYDALGRLERRRLLGSNGIAESQTFHYDAQSRLTQLNDPGQLDQTHFAYRLGFEAPRLPGATARLDGLPSEFEWASVNTHQAPERAAYLLNYNARGALTHADYQTFEGQGWNNTERFDVALRYRDNGVGQIDELRRNDASGVPHTTQYDYDGTSRRLLNTTGAIASQFAYDAAGQLTSSGEFGISSSFSYSGQGRPLSVDDGSDRLVFAYDHAGNRVSSTRFHWTVPCPTEEAVEIRNLPRPSGPRGRSPGCFVQSERRDFVWTPTGALIAEYVDGQIERLSLGTTGYVIPEGSSADLEPGLYFTLRDHLGSVRVSLRQDGTTVDTTDYDPFGLELDEGLEEGSEGQLNSFATYRRHHELSASFDFAGARLYNPRLGVFFAPDPLSAGDLSNHAYNYAANSPIAFNDPSGRFFNLGLGLIGAFAGGSIEVATQLIQHGRVENWGHVATSAAAGGIGGLTCGIGGPGAQIAIETAISTGESLVKQAQSGEGFSVGKLAADVLGNFVGGRIADGVVPSLGRLVGEANTTEAKRLLEVAGRESATTRKVFRGHRYRAEKKAATVARFVRRNIRQPFNLHTRISGAAGAYFGEVFESILVEDDFDGVFVNPDMYADDPDFESGIFFSWTCAGGQTHYEWVDFDVPEHRR